MTTISTTAMLCRLALLLLAVVLALTTTSRCAAAAFVQQAFVVVPTTVNYCDHRTTTTTSIRGIAKKPRAWAHKKDGIEERLEKLQQPQQHELLDKAGTTHPLDGSVDDVSSPASTRNNNNALFKTWTSLASFLAVVMSGSTGAAWAAGPDWGIFEGRTLSLLHPVAMAGLLFYMIYTGILGLQWRRQRTIGTEISEAKARLPDLNGAKSVAAAIAAAESAETVDAALVAKLKAALPLEQELNELQQERKALVQANPRDKHFSQGALLAFLGTLFGIEGPLNTYARAGKLFPGPHLYAGAGAVALWALASAAVPAMTKGNESARNLHIAANVGCLGLFVWQVVSGIPIVLKVLEKTSWP